MTKLAFIFPGQGSQSVGMMSNWGEQQTVVDDTFAEASDVLGYDLKSLVEQGPTEQLNQTQNTQPAMLVAGVAAFRVWNEMNLPGAELYSGHSLGEYTALVCAGSINFPDAVALVAEHVRERDHGAVRPPYRRLFVHPVAGLDLVQGPGPGA